MREEPIQEVHVLHHSEYVDNKIACRIAFPTSLGIPIELWMNSKGIVIGVNYYHDSELPKNYVRCKASNCGRLFPNKKELADHRSRVHMK